MKKQIRRCVFETNSSSTHSLTMCLKSDYDRWENGEMLLLTESYGFEDGYKPKDQFVSKEMAIESLHHYEYVDEDLNFSNEKEVNKALHSAGYRTYGDDNDDLEGFYDTFITPSGEIIVAFGEYGMDN